jgi:hypothetical protein
MQTALIKQGTFTLFGTVFEVKNTLYLNHSFIMLRKEGNS